MYSNILTSNKYGYSKSDKYVLERCIKNITLGSKEAITELYELTKSAVYGFALSILKNIHEAEDVLHDVYIKIYDNSSTYQENGNPMGWILTITKNLSLMQLRKKKHSIDIDEIIETIPSKSGHNDAHTKLLLEAAFEYISDEERNILTLHAVAGYKHHEIAKFLEIPLSTALSKYNRAIKKIRKYISEEGKI